MTDKIWELLKRGGALKWLNHLTNDNRRVAALHLACGFGCTRAVELLLKEPDVDVNVVDADTGCTPLMHCLNCHLESGPDRCGCLVVENRLLDIDLDLRNAAGQNMQQLLDSRPYHLRPHRIHRAWNTAMTWLKNDYYPSILDELKTILWPPGIATLIQNHLLPLALASP